MKKIVHLLVEAVLLILLVLLFLPLDLLSQQTAKTKVPKIGFCMDDFNVERWYRDRDMFTEKVKELGGEVLLEVAYSDTEAQIKQIRRLIEQGVDVLVIIPTEDGTALAPVITEATKKGIRVIAYDRLITNADIDYYVSHDGEMVGALMATYMIGKRPKGVYAILSGPDADANANLFKTGQMRVLQPYISRGDITLAYDGKVGEWTEMEAMILLDGFLGNYTGKLDVVLAANDDLASGVILALNDHGRKGSVLVSGQDADLSACRQIYKGDQTMTIYKPIQQLAYEAATLAMALAKKQPLKQKFKMMANGKKDVPSLLFAPIAVDRQNMSTTVLKELNISMKEIENE